MRFKSRTTSVFMGLLPMKGLSSHGRAPSLYKWNCVQLVEEFALHHPQPLLRHDRETTSIQCFLKSHFLADHIFHISAKGVRRATHDRHRALHFVRMFLTNGRFPEWLAVLQHRAKIFIQPNHYVFLPRRLGELLKSVYRVVKRLAASNNRMNEHAFS